MPQADTLAPGDFSVVPSEVLKPGTFHLVSAAGLKGTVPRGTPAKEPHAGPQAPRQQPIDAPLTEGNALDVSRGLAPSKTPPMGAVPFLDSPVTGAEQFGRGAEDLVTGHGGRMNATADLWGGAMRMLTPLAVGSAVLDPLEAGVYATYGYLSGTLGRLAAKKMGWSPAAQRLTGDVTGTFAPGAERFTRPLEGGFVTMTPEVQDRIKTNERYGLHLSGPEQASGTPQGEIGQSIQRAVSSTISGGHLQAAQRAQGDAAAQATIDGLLRQITTPGTTRGAGEAALTGVEAAKAGRSAIGDKMAAISAQQPPVDANAPLTLPNGTVVPSLKGQVEEYFVQKIWPYLDSYPDAAGKDGARIVRQMQNGRTPVEVPGPLGTPVLSDLAKKLLAALPETDQTPLTKSIKEIYFGSDRPDFESVRLQRERLYDAKNKGDANFPKRVAVTAGQVIHNINEHLFAISPEFRKYSTAFARVSDIVGDDTLVGKLLTQMKTTPSAVLNYFGADAETADKMRMTRKALLGVAAAGPEKAEARTAYDLLRSTWWQRRIVEGADGKPDPQGLYARIQQGERNGTLREWYGDAKGKELVKTATEIGKALSVRKEGMSRSLYYIFVGLQMLRGIGGMSLRKLQTAFEPEEGGGTMTWLMHNPKAAKWYVEGIHAPVTRRMVLVRRLQQAYGAYLAAHQAPSTGGQ